jgi:uncharacterized protein YjeT (DUF2065 family)
VLRQRGGPFDARLRAAPVRRVIDGEKNGVTGLCPAPMMRLGMFYLAGYLLSVGFLLMFIPQMTMNLLLTNHTYDDLGLRMGGVFLFAIGMIVVSMIINDASRMFLTTLFVRASSPFRCSCSMESIVIRLCL